MENPNTDFEFNTGEELERVLMQEALEEEKTAKDYIAENNGFFL